MKHRLWPIILLVIVFSLAQLAVEGGFSVISGKINLILVVMLLLVSLADFSSVLIFCLCSGFILDIYSGMPFGLITISLFLSVVVLEILFVNFFTNFSFYSLVLMGLIAVIGYNAIFVCLAAASYFIGWSDALPTKSYLARVAWQFASTEALLLMIYWIGGFVSRRFKPMFLR